METEDNKYGLDLHCQMILDEYNEQKPLFDKMCEVILSRIKAIFKEKNLLVTAVEGRVKTEDSLAGKLIRKGQKYDSLADITDNVGVRVITLFNDDVDRVASYMEKCFDVDWNESIDKRKMHKYDSFGYNSLHFICRIPKSVYTDLEHPEINDIRFEIQMRSTLQHAWAAMEHDIGYKSEIETPPEYKRMMGRLAGMLELTDEEFSRIRLSVADYRRRMESLINAGELSQVPLDGDTFNHFVSNGPFDNLNHRIACINQAEIQEMSFVPFFSLLKEIGLETLQDVEDFITKNEDDAYKLAMSQLAETDIDIMASTIGIQNLIIVEILKNGGGISGIKHVYDVLNGESAHNEAMARIIYNEAVKLSFMSKE